jgi:hypothetical protein
MNALQVPKNYSGGFNDLRASIFPAEDSRLPVAASLGDTSTHAVSLPNNSLTNAMAVANLEAVASFNSTLHKHKLTRLSTSYRTALSTSHRITPHRLGSSFLDFMKRFHELD